MSASTAIYALIRDSSNIVDEINNLTNDATHAQILDILQRTIHLNQQFNNISQEIITGHNSRKRHRDDVDQEAITSIICSQRYISSAVIGAKYHAHTYMTTHGVQWQPPTNSLIDIYEYFQQHNEPKLI